MSRLKQIRRAMQQKVARQGAAAVLQEVKIESKKTEENLLAKQEKDSKTIQALMMAIPTLVLVRDMGWKGLDGTPADNRRKIREFAEKLMQENERTDTADFDVKKYVEMVYEKTGVRYNYSKNGTD